jgi:hypothetical protein
VEIVYGNYPDYRIRKIRRESKNELPVEVNQLDTNNALAISIAIGSSSCVPLYFSIREFVDISIAKCGRFHRDSTKEACRHRYRSTVLCLRHPRHVVAFPCGLDRDRADAECCAWPSPLPRPVFRARRPSCCLRPCKTKIKDIYCRVRHWL